MAQISIPELQEIAVNCVTDFFNNGVSLNEGLAKQASERGLNSDQLARAVEATNTLAYLKSVDGSKDRTQEFQVASYPDVVKLASIPDSMITPPEWAPVEKQASTQEHIQLDLVKQAEESLTFSFPTLSEAEQKLHLTKFAYINARALQDAKETLEFTGEKLVKMAKSLKKDPQGLEHLSATNLEDSKFVKVASLVFGPGTERKDFVAGMFKSAQINEAQEFVDTYRKAEALHAEVEYRSGSAERIDGFRKEAGLISGAAKLVGKGIAGTAKLLSKPVVGLGKGIGNVAANTGKSFMAKGQNIFADTGVGKEIGVPKVTPPAIVPGAITRNKGILLAAGGGVMDAAAYTPKVNPAKDSSGDVWEALQS